MVNRVHTITYPKFFGDLTNDFSRCIFILLSLFLSTFSNHGFQDSSFDVFTYKYARTLRIRKKPRLSSHSPVRTKDRTSDLGPTVHLVSPVVLLYLSCFSPDLDPGDCGVSVL